MKGQNMALTVLHVPVLLDRYPPSNFFGFMVEHGGLMVEGSKSRVEGLQFRVQGLGRTPTPYPPPPTPCFLSPYPLLRTSLPLTPNTEMTARALPEYGPFWSPISSRHMIHLDRSHLEFRVSGSELGVQGVRCTSFGGERAQVWV